MKILALKAERQDQERQLRRKVWMPSLARLRKVDEALGEQGRSARAKKRAKNLGKEALKEISAKGRITMGPDGRQEAARKAMETMGAEGLSKRSLKVLETLGQTGLSDRAKKTNATRKANSGSNLPVVGNTVTNSIVCIGPVPGTANALTTAVNIAVSGAVTGTISFNGANSVTIPTVLANSGVTAGTYSLLTVNAQGLVTSGSQISNTTITTALGYIPVNRAGDTMTGGLTISPATGSFPFTYLANTAAYIRLPFRAILRLAALISAGISPMAIKNSANTVGIATFGTFNGTAILTPGIQSYANATVIFGNGNTIVTPSGTITTVTQSLGDKTTNVATTAFVTNAIGQYVSLSGATMTGDLNVANTASNANGGATRLHIDADTSGVDTARFSVVVSPQPFSNTGSAAVALDMFGGGGMQVFANTATTSSLWTVNYSVDALAGNNLGGNINFVP
ncbi:unnamed protein product [Sphagnum tenellum]